MYTSLSSRFQSVNGVVVTWNPSKVQLGVRFPLDAPFFPAKFSETMTTSSTVHTLGTHIMEREANDIRLVMFPV
jgi:hypothetical protein